MVATDPPGQPPIPDGVDKNLRQEEEDLRKAHAEDLQWHKRRKNKGSPESALWQKWLNTTAIHDTMGQTVSFLGHNRKRIAGNESFPFSSTILPWLDKKLSQTLGMIGSRVGDRRVFYELPSSKCKLGEFQGDLPRADGEHARLRSKLSCRRDDEVIPIGQESFEIPR